MSHTQMSARNGRSGSRRRGAALFLRVRAMLPLFICAVLGAILSAPAAAAVQEPPPVPAEGDGAVHRIPVSGTIELGLAPFVKRSLNAAQEAGASAAILELETPGGRVDAAQQIVDAVRDAEIPVYAYINQRAFSAGALISLATDRIYMRPGSVIGAATPVTGQAQKAPEKIVSAMRSEMRALAEARDLDPRIAEAMVDEEIEVPGVIEAGKLLTLTTEEAVDVGYAFAVDDWDALLGELQLAGADVHTADTNWAEAVVRFLTNPVVAPFLLTLGFLGLLVEIKTPTFGLAGAAGALSLMFFFGSHMIIGLAGWEELILLGAGLVLLGVEAFVVPGFGVFGIAGIAGVLASIYLSLVGRLATGADYGQAATVLSSTVLLVLVSGWALLRTLPRNRRLIHAGVLLSETTDRDTGYVSTAERPGLAGATGVALTDLRPAGAADFDGERLDVVAEGGWIEAGTRIRIARSEGYRLVVRPDADASTQAG